MHYLYCKRQNEQIHFWSYILRVLLGFFLLVRFSVKMTLDDESEFKAQVKVVELFMRCLIAWACETAGVCQPLDFPVTPKN
jgi:hypothetical protein